MANPPDFRDLDRQKTNKSLEFASFKKKVVEGVGSRVGSGKPPVPPPTPSVSQSRPAPSPTPTTTITASPAVLSNFLTGPGSQSGNGILFTALHDEKIYFNNNIVSLVPASMDIYYNGEAVATCTFDTSRVGTPFKFVVNNNNFYGNFVDGSVYFTGGPQATPSNTPPPSVTPTNTITPSPTETPAPTLPGPSPTPSITITPTITNTPEPTPTPETTPTVTPSITPSNTPPPSRTPTISVTPTKTPTMTIGASPTPTPTHTVTPSITLPYVETISPNTVVSSDGFSNEQFFIVNYGSVTGDPSGNFTIQVNSNNTSISVEAWYLDNTGSPYGTVFLPNQEFAGTYVSILTTYYDIGEEGDFYLIVEPPNTDNPHWILPELGDFQVLFRVAVSSGESGAYDWSVNPGAFTDINTTPTPTPTITPSCTVTPTPTETPSGGSPLVFLAAQKIS
jgi:hypothetical protein